MSTAEFGAAVNFYHNVSEYRTLDGNLIRIPNDNKLIKEIFSTANMELLDVPTLHLYGQSHCRNIRKCQLFAATLGIKLNIEKEKAPFGFNYPVLVDKAKSDVMIIGSNAICQYISSIHNKKSTEKQLSNTLLDLIDYEDTILDRLVKSLENGQTSTEMINDLMEALQHIESQHDIISTHILLITIYYTTLEKAMQVLSQKSTVDIASLYPQLSSFISQIHGSKLVQNVDKVLSAAATATTAGSFSSSSSSSSSSTSSSSSSSSSVANIDWMGAGLFNALKQICTEGIQAAFPQLQGVPESIAVITKCGNTTHGDYQCNNAMGIAKFVKSIPNYTGPKSPKDIGELIVKHTAYSSTNLIESMTTAPNGFINIRLSTQAFITYCTQLVQHGVQPPQMKQEKVLVDFSSPNIAKEMHVGHLRSTIIGDCICRIYEFCNHEVLRTNHVGDWGTQFGMLITYLQEEYPDILTNPPNISDLTAIYKASKKKFDADEIFKETSRLNVVKLQSGDLACTAIWKLLCNISRLEFQKVYDLLDVTLIEIGESFYNPIIPMVIEELQAQNLVVEDDGMLIIRQDKYEIPLIVRKSDGGYGYDSTDMAALSYRLRDLKCNTIIYVTDAGQANHFYMCFDAAKQVGWLTTQRVDHIGFGVVCGEDGKRFKTRSSETVRLIDLLDAAKDNMITQLTQRQQEGKSPLKEDEIIHAAKIIGYGAVKYFDLKQHPNTNYIFSYERMLDTKGDTAVYLLFAYARLASILRKANDERKIDLLALYNQAANIITLHHPAERALVYMLIQFNDVIRSVLNDLLPNRLCDYLKEVCVTFTDFVTKCHVLNAPETNSRLILCEATRRIMAQSFSLLGIGTLERI